jgi:hypothetical protein
VCVSIGGTQTCMRTPHGIASPAVRCGPTPLSTRSELGTLVRVTHRTASTVVHRRAGHRQTTAVKPVLWCQQMRPFLALESVLLNAGCWCAEKSLVQIQGGGSMRNKLPWLRDVLRVCSLLARELYVARRPVPRCYESSSVTEHEDSGLTFAGDSAHHR